MAQAYSFMAEQPKVQQDFAQAQQQWQSGMGAQQPDSGVTKSPSTWTAPTGYTGNSAANNWGQATGDNTSWDTSRDTMQQAMQTGQAQQNTWGGIPTTRPTGTPTGSLGTPTSPDASRLMQNWSPQFGAFAQQQMAARNQYDQARQMFNSQMGAQQQPTGGGQVGVASAGQPQTITAQNGMTYVRDPNSVSGWRATSPDTQSRMLQTAGGGQVGIAGVNGTTVNGTSQTGINEQYGGTGTDYPGLQELYAQFGFPGSANGPGGGGLSWGLDPWNYSAPSRFQSGVANPGTNAPAPTWLDQGNIGGMDQLFNPGNFSEPNTPYARMLENSLPYAQFMQNAQQYGMDFNEAKRRWDLETGWGQSMDQANFDLAIRQQMSAEDQARIAANQWQSQFGWGQYTDLANIGLSQQQITNTANYQGGLLGNQAQEIQNTGKYQSGLLANSATEIYNTKQYQQGLIQNQQQANQIEDQYRRGLITNEQRSLALQELTQQQTYGLQGRAQTEVERAAQAQEALRQQEINQQMSIAAMQAYGRSQAPTARWAQSWA